MPDAYTATGTDTYTGSSPATATHMQDKSLAVRGTGGITNYTFVYLRNPAPRGAAIISATLRGHVRGAGWTTSRTLTAKLLLAGFTSRTNYNNQPAVTATTSLHAATTVGALADGAEVTWNVTNAVQAMSNGTANHGFRIESTGALSLFYAFDSGFDAWRLDVEWSDAPDKPTTLVPSFGTTSLAKPTLTFDYSDVSGEDDLASVQVHIKATNTGFSATTGFTTPAFDSGEVATPLPQLDLTTTAYAGITAGATIWWTVRVKDESGQWSQYADPVSVTRTAKPTITDTTSGGTSLKTIVPIIAATSSATISAYRVIIAAGSDRTKELYNSGKVPATGTAIAHQVPARNSAGKVIFREDGNYWRGIQVYDTVLDREASPGDPVYSEVWTQFTVDKNGSQTPVSTLSVTQVGSTPRIQVQWTRATAPDSWVLVMDGKPAESWDPDDVTVVGTTYTATWLGASNYDSHTYSVRAVTGGQQSNDGPTATLALDVRGVWLIRDNGDAVVLDEPESGASTSDWQQVDRRGIYKPLNSGLDVDVVSAIEGISGSFSGSLRPDANRAAGLAVLRALKDRPMEVVQLCAGEINIPVRLRNLSPDLPAEGYKMTRRTNRVSFNFAQAGSVPYGIG